MTQAHKGHLVIGVHRAGVLSRTVQCHVIGVVVYFPARKINRNTGHSSDSLPCTKHYSAVALAIGTDLSTRQFSDDTKPLASQKGALLTSAGNRLYLSFDKISIE